MAKYHIKKDGTPGICRAKSGNCPLGGSESHFDSIEAANAEAQRKMETEFGLVDEPYSPRAIIVGADASAYDYAVMKGINTDGVIIEKSHNPGYSPKYQVKELQRGETISFKEHRSTTDSVNDYLTNAEHEQEFKVNVNGKSSIMNSKKLNQTIAAKKNKARLEEVTHRAVAQFNQMDYNLPGTQQLQKRIRENEIAGDFVANTALEKKSTSRKINDRVMSAESGYAQETLANDKNEFVRAAVASNGDPVLLEKLKSDDNPMVRAVVADKGHALDELVHDNDPTVRAAVANHGYGANTLKHDDDYRVRMGVASSGRELDTLMNDKDPRVRFAVVKSVSPGPYGKDRFINDESPIIRKHLAEQGVGIETLINDKDPEVRKAAEKYKSK